MVPFLMLAVLQAVRDELPESSQDKIPPLLGLLSWQGYLALGLAVLLVVALEGAYRNKVSQSGSRPLRLTVDQPRSAPKSHSRFVRLKVDNDGENTLEGCYGKLVCITPLGEASCEIPEPGQNLCWSTRGGGQGNLRTAIAPKSQEFLDVAFAQHYSFLKLARQKSPLDQRQGVVESCHFVFSDWQTWSLPQGEYLVQIEVGALDVAMPTIGHYKLCYAGGLNLSLDEIDKAGHPN